jgi:F-type H+-transporting ATPase subunit delta
MATVVSQAAIRYATSLLGLSKEKNELDVVKKDMEALVKVAADSREFRMMLSSPVIPHSKKETILLQVFSNASTITKAFFTLLARKNREALLAEIGTAFIDLYNINKGIQPVHVSTALPLTSDLRTKLTDVVSKATGKDVRLTESVSEELIGGYVLRINDRQIDQSVKHQLTMLKNQFKSNS